MKSIKYLTAVLSVLALAACTDFLDMAPESEHTPESFLTSAANLESYAYSLYPSILPSHGPYEYGHFQSDRDTDDMAYVNPSDIYAPGYVRVPESGGAYDSWWNIYNINYFFGIVNDLYAKGEIEGDDERVRHAIGEMYFFRAYDYFTKLQALGDLPIITEVMPNELETLKAASVRRPRNEVARFILSDLDTAIEYLSNAPLGGKSRISRDCAHLLKARVALYEATWLRYFTDTAFVPGGPEWPGYSKSDDEYVYPLGDIESEIEWFLQQAMTESEIVADKYTLTPNTGTYEKAQDGIDNPYYAMFSSEDMSQFSEVMLWRGYNVDLITNCVGQWAASSNCGFGTTKSMVEAFVMANGLPIYAEGSGYPGDADLKRITEGRDARAVVFIKKPGDENLIDEPVGPASKIEPWPDITAAGTEYRYTTGYVLRKGMSNYGIQTKTGSSTIGHVVFRASEAYLTYIEACYELTGAIDAKADGYWRAIRKRAHVDEDYQKTIDATKMAKEKADWGAWSAGELLSDKTLYNIRRERRCEFMAEGLRSMDLHRWRSMDQMMDIPYHVYGMNLWGNVDLDKFPTAVEGVNVSQSSDGDYLAPYRIFENNHVYGGYQWMMAHYLSPIAIQHFLITGDGNVDESPLYQNPGWPMVANESPIY